MAAKQLLTIVSELHEVYAALYEAGMTKKDLIIQARTDELPGIAIRESELLNQYAAIMQRWHTAVKQLQEGAGVPASEPLSHAQVGEWIEEPQVAAAYRQALEQLNIAAQALRELNERNQQLLQQSIGMIGDLLDQTVGPAELEVSYGDPSASQKTPRRTGGFDYRM